MMAITSTTSPSLHNVFVYGSLLADEVVKSVLHRVPASSPAILNGFHRFSIKGRLYPAILPVENKSVTGKNEDDNVTVEIDELQNESSSSNNWPLKADNKNSKLYLGIEIIECGKLDVTIRQSGMVLQGVTDLELDALDAFEDVEYNRGTVEISLLDNSEKLLAYTYIWGDKDDPDLYGFWDFDEWKQLHMKEFLAMTESFMEEIERRSESRTRLQVFKEREQQQEK